MVNVKFDNSDVKSVNLAHFRSANKNDRITFYNTDDEKTSIDPSLKYDHIDIGIDDGLVICVYKEQHETTLFASFQFTQ